MDNAIVTASPTAMVVQSAQPADARHGTALADPARRACSGWPWPASWGWLAVLAMMFGGARDADYRVLFPNLSEKDGGQVIEKLTQLNVPYRFTEGGGAIMVPAGRVHELRMKLAAAGLPSVPPAAAATSCWTRTASARPRARSA
jgi:flagellar M-ring protein FliF